MNDLETSTPETPASPAESRDERRFSQADVDRIVRERLERERRQADERQAQAQRQAEEAALQQQGEFRRLAEERQARLNDLEPVAARATRYEAALQAQLQRERANVPAYVIPLLDRLDPAEQLEYLAANREALIPPAAAPEPPPPVGAAPNLNAGGARTSAPVDAAERESELRARFRL